MTARRGGVVRESLTPEELVRLLIEARLDELERLAEGPYWSIEPRLMHQVVVDRIKVLHLERDAEATEAGGS